MEQQELHLTVNGEDHTLACDPDLPLLDVLRAGLGLAGRGSAAALACAAPAW